MFFDKSISDVMAINVAGDRTNPVARAISYGVPGLIGVNLTDYAGIGSLKEITRGLYGPAIADTKSTYDFLVESVADVASVGVVRDETYNRFFQKVQPSAYRRLRRGLDILHTGRVNDPVTGNLIYKPYKVCDLPQNFGFNYDKENDKEGIGSWFNYRGYTYIIDSIAKS